MNDPWDEPLEEFAVEPLDEEEALMARVPALGGTPKKTEYLGWRAAGFNVSEACQLVGIKRDTVLRWRKADEQFAHFEGPGLPELQKEIGPDLLRNQFMRTMRLMLHQDADVVRKRAFEPYLMTDQDEEYYRQVRKLYTPNELMNLEKALNPRIRDEGDKQITIKLTWGSPTQMFEAEEGSDGIFRTG